MTTPPPAGGQPAPTPRTPDDLEALLLIQAATLLTLEAGSAHAATASLRFAVASLARTAAGHQLLAALQPTSSEPLPPDVRNRVVAALRAGLSQASEAVDQIGSTLAREAAHALDVGAQFAAQQVSLPAAPAAVKLDPIANALIKATPQTAQAHLDAAAKLLNKASTGLDLQDALAEASRAVTAADTGTRYLTNHVAGDAARQVAVHLGEKLLWVAERDACLVCLALAGHIADPAEGIGFDETATYAATPAPDIWPPGMPLMRPPRHPRCRCQVCVWLGSAPGRPDLPSALKREAARSVLKGWSKSDSNRQRLAAAGQLLNHGGAGLPKSVQTAAAHAVASGRFATPEVPVYVPQPRKANA